MSKHPLYVMILWHMHQPYYKDLNRQEYFLPWVRLHATKDYLDMPLLAAEYPDLRLTFNLVPSLLEQIEEYAAGDAVDPWLRLATRNAEELGEDERVTLLQLFFAAHYDNMIRPYPRYRQLHERRGAFNNPQELRRAAQQFAPADLRDLQTWFYLTWIDPYLRGKDPRLLALLEKAEGFSEQEKLEVLEIGRELTGRIVPAMKSLWEKGQLEVSTTPYFHPILPLLIDTDLARRARPRMPLPGRRFQHPDDAALQIRLGLDYCQESFGQRPRGMWPSEGSVCPELIPLFQQAGVRWTASDEDVLAQSLNLEHFARDRNGLVENSDLLYRPYFASHQGARTAIFFRDHFLSDQIGFKYAHWEPRAAARDLIQRLEEVQFKLQDSAEPHVVSIILDGENCWEHYQGDGEPFLRELYQALSSHRQLKTITPSAYLDLFPDQRPLDKLHSGSWINHDYSVWIGHPEDNASWELLAQAREDIGGFIDNGGQQVDEIARQKALKSILVAEGSDWNWWYGDEHHSDYDEQFDALYRQHLRNAYSALGMKIPSRFYIPINTHRESGAQVNPCAFLSPRIDGHVSNYFEWFSAGHYDPQRSGGSMHQQTASVIESLYYGFDTKHFYLRTDLSEIFKKTLLIAPVELVIYIFSGQNYKIACPIPFNDAKAGRIYREADGWVDDGAFDDYAFDAIFELAADFKRFQIVPDKMLRFQIAIELEYHEVERCPGNAPLSTSVPNDNFEEIMWIV